MVFGMIIHPFQSHRAMRPLDCLFAQPLTGRSRARFCQTSFFTSTRAVARSEQPEARGRRKPEAYAVYVEGFRHRERGEATHIGAALAVRSVGVFVVVT